MSGRYVYTISARAHYDAAHFLENYDGKCSRVHGHRYVAEAAIQSPELDENGLAFDFADLKRELRALADRLDHELLNDLPEFDGVPTSAENQARWFYESLQGRLPDALAGGLIYARVWESPTQWAQYGPEGAPLPAPGGLSGE